MVLPEDGALGDIQAFFAEHHFELVSHQEPPPQPTAEEGRRMSTLERKARERAQRNGHWADLKRMETGQLVRWYGGGVTHEAAVRSARARWSVEQGN